MRIARLRAPRCGQCKAKDEFWVQPTLPVGVLGDGLDDAGPPAVVGCKVNRAKIIDLAQ